MSGYGIIGVLKSKTRISPIICERFRGCREWRDVKDTMLFVHVSELTKP